ncbi:AI-2E family transporter [Planococcus lenghuensis]|uniref:AI-2E family transporter n=1 Tax=Planococcus lenghuensis TaxID=2213202 RepID=A0A1Q2KUX1_9BACL|nr:AI-2E family transporter [Planococcus lenghuensis]AQQ52018.1 AI-2E family transporter [Planococcus lenghuensis]
MTSRLWFQAGVGIALALLIIFLATQVEMIFSPIITIISAIIIPIVLGGVLFYLTYPLQRFVESRFRFPRWASIATVIVTILIAIAIFITLIGPAITEQVTRLTEAAPRITNQIQGYIDYLLNQRNRLPGNTEQYLSNFTDNIGSWTGNIGNWLWSFTVNLAQGIFYIILAPFFLIYMLKDHEKFAPFVAKFFTGERRVWIRKTLHDIDRTLKAYIQGQILVSFLVGILLLIGYWIIGLDFALILALLGMLLNLIPFLGPYLAAAPAMGIAFLQEPIMALYVAIIMFVAQQIEGALITPNVMGNALNVHPLTVIAIILAAGSLFGFFGIIVAVPVYAVIKDIVRNLYAQRQEISETAARDVDGEP